MASFLRAAAAIAAVAAVAAGATGAAGATDSVPRARAVQQGGVWWLASGNGRPFFSLGVNVVDRGVAREAYRESEPAYAAFRYYATSGAWAASATSRLKRWGFDTLGGWCDTTLAGPGAGREFALMPVLDVGRRLGVPWSDLFSSSMEERFDAEAVRAVAPWKKRPNLFGYFLDNELGWWGDTLFVFTLRQPATNATRQKLIALLRSRYLDFDSLRKDFATDATDFDALSRKGALSIRPGGAGSQVVDEFLGLLAERYYELAARAVRRASPHALILGDRYLGFYEWPVVGAAARHVDVVSTNYGAEWSDGRTTRYFLETLHALTSKPILVSELYFAAKENRSGNRNTGALFPTVTTQRERAAAARRQLDALARLPFVVGAHWFQYYDEPTHGRSDGEDYNMGLVDIHDVPYAELTGAIAALDVQGAHRGAEAASGGDGQVPRTVAAALEAWDLTRAFVEPSQRDAHAGAFADLYVTWDDDALRIGIVAAGFADRELYADRVVPPESQLRLTVRADAVRSTAVVGPVAALAGAAPAGAESGGCHHTRCRAVISIPAKQLGAARLSAGRRVPIDAELVYRGRRMAWKRTVTLGER